MTMIHSKQVQNRMDKNQHLGMMLKDYMIVRLCQCTNYSNVLYAVSNTPHIMSRGSKLNLFDNDLNFQCD